MAPPAHLVTALMQQLFGWLNTTRAHPLITSCVFHYEFEFIHPFSDGNGRLGRLWQTLILARWHPLFAELPVESLVHAHQQEYYAALDASNRAANAAPFLAFMLGMIEEAVRTVTPQVTPQSAAPPRYLPDAMRANARPPTS